MAAAITTAGTTLEAQMLEVAIAGNELEKGLPDEQNQGRYNLAFDAEAGQVSISLTLDAAFTVTSGNVVVTAQEYV